MSKYDKNSTARLPLIESVIIIAVFAIISVLIMQLYVSADRLQKKSVNISKATILAENRAEAVSSGAEIVAGASQENMQGYFGKNVSEVFAYDKDWNKIAEGSSAEALYNYSGQGSKATGASNPEAKFFMTTTVTVSKEGTSGDLNNLEIVVTDASGEVLADIATSFFSENKK